MPLPVIDLIGLPSDSNSSFERGPALAPNAIRRALLFRRRGHMWRELPSDTQWWEVTLEADDLLARVILHELDHLNGVLYPMRMRDFTRFGFTEVVAPGVTYAPPRARLRMQARWVALPTESTARRSSTSASSCCRSLISPDSSRSRRC